MKVIVELPVTSKLHVYSLGPTSEAVQWLKIVHVTRETHETPKICNSSHQVRMGDRSRRKVKISDSDQGAASSESHDISIWSPVPVEIKVCMSVIHFCFTYCRTP